MDCPTVLLCLDTLCIFKNITTSYQFKSHQVNLKKKEIIKELPANSHKMKLLFLVAINNFFKGI